jgi:O-acetyl-ADP-ribose deacetylase (regulator of RNase III)
MKELYRSPEGRCIVSVGDITTLACDAIVNAANSSLLGGGGVDGAIHRAGGPEILAECKALRRGPLPDGLPAGKAVATTAGRLPAKRVIHTVGPIWRGGTHHEDETLESCYRESLALAAREGLESVAFPAISTGVYRFPRERAARIAWRTVREFLESAHKPPCGTSPSTPGAPCPRTVWFVFFSDADARLFLETNALS